MKAEDTYKVVVKMKRRPDGGLRVWSDQVPGLVLSHSDPARVLADIEPALEFLLSERFGCAVKAERLSQLPVFGPKRTFRQRLIEAAESRMGPLLDLVDKHFSPTRDKLEFVAHPCHG